MTPATECIQITHADTPIKKAVYPGGHRHTSDDEERETVCRRISLEIDAGAAFAMFVVATHERFGVEVIRAVGILLDRLDEAELRALDGAVRLVRAREAT